MYMYNIKQVTKTLDLSEIKKLHTIKQNLFFLGYMCIVFVILMNASEIHALELVPIELPEFGSNGVINGVGPGLRFIPSSSSSSSCDDCIPPTLGQNTEGEQILQDGFSFNYNVVDVQFFHTEFPLIITSTNQTNTITLKIYENNGIDNIFLVQFGFGISEIGSPLSTAETLVEVWFEPTDTQIKEIVIKDEHNLIDDTSISISTQDVSCGQNNSLHCLEVVMNYAYLDSPIFDVFAISLSDQSRNTVIHYFNDGIRVEGESMNLPNMITVPAAFSGNGLYPQQKGLVELVQIDKKMNLWNDTFGYVWQGNEQKIQVISDIPFESKVKKNTLHDAIQLEIEKAEHILISYFHMDSSAYGFRYD